MRRALTRHTLARLAWLTCFAGLTWRACFAGPGTATARPLAYPATPRDSVVDDYHGVPVPDPYRWLEQLDSPRTRDWVRAQTALTQGYLRGLPGREVIRRRLTTLWNDSRTGVPWREAGRLWFTETRGLERQPVLYGLDSPGAAPRAVLDPRKISPDGSIAVRDFAVSPDGRWLAYTRAPGGADLGDTHVLDLAGGRERADVVRGSWSSVCWTFDGGGFFYMRPPAPKPGADPAAARLAKQLYYHVLGRPQAEDRLLHEWPDARWLYGMMSDDGRRAIVVAERGSDTRMYAMDLRDAQAPDLSAPLVPLLGDATASSTPMGTVGDTLYAFSDLGAPRGCVLALDLRAGADARPRVVVSETTEVIEGATVAGDRLAVHYLEDVKSRLRLFSLDGRPAGEVALPGIGALGWALNGRNSARELWYSFTSFLAPETVYRYDLDTGASAAFHRPRVAFDPGPYETRQVFYASQDGTRVSMFLTARRDLPKDGANPVFLTAYGGYGIITGPSYEPDIPLWLEMGGVYALASIRGGGEYGEEWHRAGMREHKQNGFDDFIAAAEYLVAQGYTSPGKIAIYGHSNGGLLVGAVLTQRPDLFGVAIANAGHYDMLRYHRFTVGAGWIPEFGSPDDSSAFPYLRAYSPLHNVRPGACYPATLLLAADHDDRVVPSHAYKFAAALQAGQACDRPILLRVAGDASHSYASAAAQIEELSDRWAFTAARLGARLPGARPPGAR